MKKISVFLLFLFGLVETHAAVYNITEFGAVGDGTTLTTKAIQKTIDRCYRDGGGQVYVPQGVYLTGTLNLKSNVEFHFETGAVLKATTDLTQYQKHNEFPAGVFYTENADNVSITGNGTIFGQGMEFMYADSAKIITGDAVKYIRQKENFRKVESGVGDGPLYPKDRFHQMIVFSNCTNVTLKDFKCKDAPYWTFLIVHCEDVIVRGLRIDNNLLIPNSDGLDINSSSNVTVSDCIFSCGDDAIVLAGYAHHYGDPGYKDILKPSRNIMVSNCVLRSRSSAIRVGGWDQNAMENYSFNNITIYESNCGINITVRDREGLTNANFSNISIETRQHTGDWWGNGEPIKISCLKGVEGASVGSVKNVNFSNINCVGENAILLYAEDPGMIDNVSFDHFTFTLKQSKLEKVSGGNFDLRPNIVEGKEIYASDIPIFHVENATNIHLTNGTLSWGEVHESYFKNAIKAINVNGFDIKSTTAQPSPVYPKSKAVDFDNCNRVNSEL
ncbi:MAG: glycoside hydrolase family 28 protein [Prevotella sp.]